jgi:hypothetical protein
LIDFVSFVVYLTFQVARGDTTDPTVSNLILILFCLLTVGVVALLAFVPIRVALGRNHRQIEILTTLMIFWSVATAGLAIKSFLEQQKWSAEHQSQILSGYFDPADESSRPAWPVKNAIGLGVAYCGLAAWAIGAKPR